MTNRFVILVDDATAEQQNAVTLFFKGKFGYWHHFSDAWLITTKSDEWTTAKLRDAVRDVVPGLYILVLKIDSPKGWSAFGAKDMFEWLKSTWKAE